MLSTRFLRIAVTVGLLGTARSLSAQLPGAPAAPTARAVPAAAPLRLLADVTDAPTRKLIHARLFLPVGGPGPLTLVYPKWIPGEHGPTGPLNSLVDLRLLARGQPVPWRRDLVDMYAIRCEVPAGTDELEITFDDLIPVGTGGYSSGTSVSPEMVIVNWNQLVLYPAGTPTDQLRCQAQLRLPGGWQYGCPLPVSRTLGAAVEFAPVSLTTLVDSPLVSGAHFRRIVLSDGRDPAAAGPPNEIDVVADSAAALELPAEQVAAYQRLVREAGALFGAYHYEGYHFLVGLSEAIQHSGIEHHQSSLNTMPERAWVEKDLRDGWSGLLPHEFVHSWNGKHRRPADLTTPDFQQPMAGDLLWVYEGLTEYLGSLVLTARAGVADAEFQREFLAAAAADLEGRSGRAWRPLQDTADAAQILYEARGEGVDRRRRVDFYTEGMFLWLEADCLIRQLSNDQRSFDDFTRRFHGPPGGTPTVKTYTFDDVVATLDQVATYDWRAWLRTRLDAVAPRTPLPRSGLAAAGWRLVFNATPNRVIQLAADGRKSIDLTLSLGLTLSKEGNVVDVVANSPADQAGVGPGMKIVGINGRTFSPERLTEALRLGAAGGAGPTELLCLLEDTYRTISVSYHGGERYPHLERDPARPDLLGAILKPHATP